VRTTAIDSTSDTLAISAGRAAPARDTVGIGAAKPADGAGRLNMVQLEASPSTAPFPNLPIAGNSGEAVGK
jgi:hypothetical protein